MAGRRRSRRNAGAQFTVFHEDHSISRKQMRYIRKKLESDAPQGFFISQISIPESYGTVLSALYGPDAGDRPIKESRVHYMDRSGRGWEDRMIDLPLRLVRYVQAIGTREGDTFTLFTVYGGPLAPQNPADPGNQDVAGSKRFWKKHALSSDQW